MSNEEIIARLNMHREMETEGAMRNPIAELDAAVAKCMDERAADFARDMAKVELYPDMLDALKGARNDLRLQGFAITAKQYDDIIERASALQDGGG